MYYVGVHGNVLHNACPHKKKKQKEENKMMNNGEDTIVQWFPKHLITCITFHFGIEFMGLLWYYHFLSLRLEHHPEL